MIHVTDEHRAEAKRLLDLDEEGQREELLAQALAIVGDARAASEELARLDREMLDAIFDQKPGPEPDPSA